MNRSPFDDPEAMYRVLISGEGQYSLWPAFAAPPLGWRVARELDTRAACLQYIEHAWIDMRPDSGTQQAT